MVVKQPKGFGVEFHDFNKVGQEIINAVVARVGVVFVRNVFPQQFVVQAGCAFFKSVIIVLATIEIDRHLAQGRRILLG